MNAYILLNKASQSQPQVPEGADESVLRLQQLLEVRTGNLLLASERAAPRARNEFLALGAPRDVLKPPTPRRPWPLLCPIWLPGFPFARGATAGEAEREIAGWWSGRRQKAGRAGQGRTGHHRASRAEHGGDGGGERVVLWAFWLGTASKHSITDTTVTKKRLCAVNGGYTQWPSIFIISIG
jgi:hypothetical protein